MATWQAIVKVGDSGSPFKVEVVAGSYNTAKETIETIYNPVYIRNLLQVSTNDEYSSVKTGRPRSIKGKYLFVGFVFALYVATTYWYIVVPVVFILATFWLWTRNS
jgi:hypothetical protein